MKRVLILAGIIFTGITATQAQNNWDLGVFEKPKENPVMNRDSSLIFYCPMKKDSVRWAKADVFNPAAIVKDGKVYLFTRCEDNPLAHLGGRTSRIGISVSDDGLHFRKFREPVLFPQEDEFKQYDYPGGCEDPRVVETEDGQYIMTYSSWNYKNPKLSIAFSKDLFHWQKKGPAFKEAYNGKFFNIWTKSGSIVTKIIKGRPIAAKICGKYWMYWGEAFVNLAWSENGYDWYPMMDEKGNLKRLIEPRPGKFDSNLTECGPPALMTDKGIILMYNGKNACDAKAASDLPKGMYAVGEVLFDSNDPSKVLERTDTYILRPSLPHEITGQYKAGTTFAEGLVHFKKQWFLYYGTADSYVGVAVTKKK